jgi:hypothetical protein
MMAGDCDGGDPERTPSGVLYSMQARILVIDQIGAAGRSVMVRRGPLLARRGPRTKLVRFPGPVKSGPGRHICLFKLFADQRARTTRTALDQKNYFFGIHHEFPLDRNVVHNC